MFSAILLLGHLKIDRLLIIWTPASLKWEPHIYILGLLNTYVMLLSILEIVNSHKSFFCSRSEYGSM